MMLYFVVFKNKKDIDYKLFSNTIFDNENEAKDFGKKIGGDILRNKKTILYHMILKKGNLEHQEKIKKILSLTQENLNAEEKINQAKNIYIESGAKDGAREMINFYSNSAEEKIKLLEQIYKVQKNH